MLSRSRRTIPLIEAVCYHHLYRAYHVTRNPREEPREKEVEGSVKPNVTKSVRSLMGNEGEKTDFNSSLSGVRDRLQSMSSSVSERLSTLQHQIQEQVQQYQQPTTQQIQPENSTKIEASQAGPIEEQQSDLNASRSLLSRLLRIFPDPNTPPSIFDSLIRPLIVIAACMVVCWFWCLHETGFTNPELLHNLRANLIVITTGLYLLLQRLSVLRLLRSFFSPKRFAALILFLTKGVLNTGISLVTNLISVVPKNIRDGFIKMTKSKNSVESIISVSQRMKFLLGGMLLIWFVVGGGMNKDVDPFKSEDALVQHGDFKKQVQLNNAFWYQSLYKIFLKQATEVWTLTLPFFVMAIRESENFTTPSRPIMFLSRLCSSLGVVMFLGGMGLQFAHRVQRQLFDPKEEYFRESFFYFINKYKIQIGEEMIWISFSLVATACLLAKRQSVLMKMGGIVGSAAAPALMWHLIAKDQIDERDRKEVWKMVVYDAYFGAAFIKQCIIQLWNLIKTQLANVQK
jgi:hypothetical protein